MPIYQHWILTTTQLQDFLQNRFNNDFPTHTKGNKLDVILGSPFRQQFITSCGILSSSQGAMSDHFPLFIDIGTNLIKQGKNPALPNQRHLTSKYKKAFHRLGATVNSKVISNHNISQITTKISAGEITPHIINSLDRCLTKIFTTEYNQRNQRSKI